MNSRVRGPAPLVLFTLLIVLFFPAPGSLSADENAAPWAVHARLVMEAYLESYPDDISAIEWLEDDWTIVAGGRRFWWAEGRFLPEDLRKDWASYKPYVNYDYPHEIPDPGSYSPDYVEEILKMGSVAYRAQIKERCLEFQAAIFGTLNRRAIEARLERVSLFGWTVRIDRKVAANLRRVNTRVQTLAVSDPEIAAFIRSLGPIGSYNWREIQGTPVASYHSYGLAVDILPRRMGRLATFWNWERVHNPNWPVLSLSRRWHPPQAVVEAFEDEGFIWGGKWELWDTMHFEYRPELLWLRGLLEESFSAPRGGHDEASLDRPAD